MYSLLATTSIFLLAATSVVASPAAAPAACNADNCLRAIRATARLTQASADCSSYWKVTVTPSTSTSTVLVTAPATITDVKTITQQTITTSTSMLPLLHPGRDIYRNAHANDEHEKRAAVAVISPNTATGIPSYASACSGAARFTSACSCIGVTPVTVTAAAPTAIVTQTITSTSTISATTTTVAVSTSVTTYQSCRIKLDDTGRYLYAFAPGSGWIYGQVVTDRSKATRWSVNAQNKLNTGGALLLGVYSTPFSTLMMVESGKTPAAGNTAVLCQPLVDGQPVSCQLEGSSGGFFPYTYLQSYHLGVTDNAANVPPNDARVYTFVAEC